MANTARDFMGAIVRELKKCRRGTKKVVVDFYEVNGATFGM
jgi:hypothetical protein